MSSTRRSAFAAVLAIGLFSAQAPAVAEISEIKIAKQYGISYLPLMLMESDRLMEKAAEDAGLKELKVSWATFTAGNVMNDAILSNSLQIASGGVGPLIQMWAATKSKLEVKCVAAMNSMPLYLVTRNPDVKSIRDLSAKDKIALPAVRISIQALTLQIAAEREFGPGQANKFDPLTVAMAHPEAQAAMLSGISEINGHFGSPPFQYSELKQPGMRRILNSYEVMGGPTSFNFVWASKKFHDENPKTYATFVKAFEGAIAAINGNRKLAAERYLAIAGDKKSTVDEILGMLNDPEIEFTTTPKATMKYADFMYKTGAIKVKPERWSDLCFENVHGLVGS